MAKIPSSRKYCGFCIPQRWIFTILASIGLCLMSIYSSFLSIVIIEMVVKNDDCEEKDGVGCKNANEGSLTNNTAFGDQKHASIIERYSWDEYTQGSIFSSFFWSATIYHFFSGPLAERYGGKHLLGFGIFSQALLTFTTPFLINWGGSITLIVTRALIGLTFGGMFPIASTMISHWTTPAERTKVGNAVYSGFLVGAFFGNILPAQIIKFSGMGWPAVFYVFGIIGIIWFPFWLIFVYETPEVHLFISNEELQYFQNNPEVKKDEILRPPWKRIFLSKAFWAFTIMYIGSNWAFYVMFTSLPKYMDSVVKFSLESNGYFSALPYLCMWLNTMLSAWISNKILEKKWMNLTNVRKLLSTASTTGPIIFLLQASYANDNKLTVVIMFTIGITLIGSSYPSLLMNPLDLSPNYAGSIMSLGSGIASIVGIITPYLVGVLAPNSTLTEWRLIFWIVFLLAVASSAVYLAWFKAEVQPWNDPEFLRNSNKKKDSEM